MTRTDLRNQMAQILETNRTDAMAAAVFLGLTDIATSLETMNGHLSHLRTLANNVDHQSDFSELAKAMESIAQSIRFKA